MGDVEINQKDYKLSEETTCTSTNLTTYKLSINEATVERDGRYTCKITNEFGSIENSCKVTVNCKPKIRKTLVDTEVDEGTTLVLEVEIYAEPEPEITWTKDGQEVHADARVKIVRDTKRLENYSLVLNMVKGSDSGDYEIKATNKMGTSTSKSRVVVQSEYKSLIIIRHLILIIIN